MVGSATGLSYYKWSPWTVHCRIIGHLRPYTLQKSIHYFDNCICHQNCNCWLEIVPCGNQLWQYNTHGVLEQLKLLQGLGINLLRHQISAIHNKGFVPSQRSLSCELRYSYRTHTHSDLVDVPMGCQWGNLDQLPGRLLMQLVWYQSKPRVITVWLKWAISFYSGKDLSIVAVHHKGCIGHIAHRWLSQGTNFASSLKTMSQLQFCWQMQLPK